MEWLADRLRDDERFEEPDVLLGSANCQPLPILSALGSKKYGLIHYSGHTQFDGYRSAWQLADGKTITTDRLTSALQMGPPAFVFSSSCESAAGGSPEPVRYENQTFDLPSAFLQAGVEAYIGTLWEVEATAARRFVVDFYEAFPERGPRIWASACAAPSGRASRTSSPPTASTGCRLSCTVIRI